MKRLLVGFGRRGTGWVRGMLAGGMMLWAVAAGAVEIRIDFANNSTTGNPTGNWNVIASPSGGPYSLIDFGTGAASGVSLTFADDMWGPGNSNAGQWSGSPVFRSWIDPVATNDYHYLQTTNLTGRLVFTGLDPTKTYRVEMLASRSGGDSGNREGNYQVNGLFSDNGNSNRYDAYGHGYVQHQVMTWRSVKAPGGTITVDLETWTTEVALYLSAMRITEAPPQTVLFDLGSSASNLITPGRWNNASFSGAPVPGHYVLGAVDAGGQRLPIRLSVLQSFSDTNSSGVVSDAAGFAATAQADSFAVASGATGVIQIEGLVPGQMYNITLFGSRQTTGDTRTSRYTIGTLSQDLVNTDNAQNSVTFSGVQADARGHIQIKTEAAPGSQFGYLGVVELTGTFASGPLPVQALLFDFGSANTGFPTPGRWNNVTTVGTGQKIANAIDSLLGQPTGVSLSITDNFNEINEAGVVSYAAGFPSTAQRDSFVLKRPDVNNTTAQILLEGLNPGLLYNFTFFGSRATGGPAGYKAFEVQIGSQIALLENEANTENTVTLYGIRPDALGRVYIDFRLPPTAQYGYLGVMEVMAVVPEPASMVLMGLGLVLGLAPLAWRVRRRQRV